MAKVKLTLTAPFCQQTNGGAMILEHPETGDRYTVRGADARRWGLVDGSQLRSAPITLWVESDPQEYDPALDVFDDNGRLVSSDNDMTQSGLIKASIQSFRTDLDSLDLAAGIAEASTKIIENRIASRKLSALGRSNRQATRRVTAQQDLTADDNQGASEEQDLTSQLNDQDNQPAVVEETKGAATNVATKPSQPKGRRK